MEENHNQIQKKSLSIKNLGTYLFKEIKKKHRLKLKGTKQIAPRGISPVIMRPGSRINELQERGAKIKRALEQFAPPLNSTEIFEDKEPSAHQNNNKENQQNPIDATSLHKLVNERLGGAPNRLSVSSSGFHNARTPPCTPLKSKNQGMSSFMDNTNNKTTMQNEVTVENTVCTSKVPIMEDDMEEDVHEANNSNENESGLRIQISGSHGDSDSEDEDQEEEAHEDETEDDERLRQVLCTFFPQSTSASMDNSHVTRRAKTFSRTDVSNALDMLCSSPDRRKNNILNSSTGSLTSLGWNPPMSHNTSYLTTTPARRNFQQEDLSLSPLSIKSPISSTPSSVASSTSKDRKDWKKNRTFSLSSFKK